MCSSDLADLASCTYRPQLCFALRLRDPRLTQSSIELVHTHRSSHQALSAVKHWLTAIGFAVATAQDPEAQS